MNTRNKTCYDNENTKKIKITSVLKHMLHGFQTLVTDEMNSLEGNERMFVFFAMEHREEKRPLNMRSEKMTT